LRDFTEENASIIRPLFPTRCRLFRRGHLETEPHLALADFIDSLLLLAEPFARDTDCHLWDCFMFANIARLRDLAIRKVEDFRRSLPDLP
jgi:hypothetical protein